MTGQVLYPGGNLPFEKLPKNISYSKCFSAWLSVHVDCAAQRVSQKRMSQLSLLARPPCFFSSLSAFALFTNGRNYSVIHFFTENPQSLQRRELQRWKGKDGQKHRVSFSGIKMPSGFRYVLQTMKLVVSSLFCLSLHILCWYIIYRVVGPGAQRTENEQIPEQRLGGHCRLPPLVGRSSYHVCAALGVCVPCF